MNDSTKKPEIISRVQRVLRFFWQIMVGDVEVEGGEKQPYILIGLTRIPLFVAFLIRKYF